MLLNDMLTSQAVLKSIKIEILKFSWLPDLFKEIIKID